MWSEQRISADEYYEFTGRFPKEQAAASDFVEERAAPKVKKVKQEQFGAIQLILAIGVLFVIIAGFILTTATWDILSQPLRILLLGLQTSIFFVVSFIARKKLKLPVTGNAFYILGCLFSLISTLAAGIFGNIEIFTALSLSFAVSTIPTLYGAWIFKKELFVWLSGLSVYGMIAAGIFQLTQMIEVVFLVTGIIACVLLALTVIKDKISIPAELKKSLNLFSIVAFFGFTLLLFGYSLTVEKYGTLNGAIILASSTMFLLFLTWLCIEEKIKHIWTLHSFLSLWVIHNVASLLFGSLDANKLFQVILIMSLYWWYKLKMKRESQIAVLTYNIALPLKAVLTVFMFTCTIESFLALLLITGTMIAVTLMEKSSLNSHISAWVSSFLILLTQGSYIQALWSEHDLVTGVYFIFMIATFILATITANLKEKYNADKFRWSALAALIVQTGVSYSIIWGTNTEITRLLPIAGMILILLHGMSILLTKEKQKLLPILIGLTIFGLTLEVMNLVEYFKKITIQADVRLMVLATVGTVLLGIVTLVRSKKVFNVMFIIASQLLLLAFYFECWHGYSPNIGIYIVAILLAIVNYTLLYLQKQDKFAFVPALSFQILISLMISSEWHNIIASAAIFAACLAISSLLYRKQRFNWIKMAAIWTPFLWIDYGKAHYPLIGWILAAIFIQHFVFYGQKIKDYDILDRAFSTLATLPLLIGWHTQVLYRIPDLIYLEHQVAVFLLIMLYNTKVLWNTHKRIADWLFFAASAGSLGVLAAVALNNITAADALIIGGSAIAILIVANVVRRKRWFLLSIVTLIGLILYYTADLWTSIAWWIYLLIAGIILIIIAAANESYKQGGSNIKEKILSMKVFNNWEW